jgi:hypothetical protein
MRRSRGRRASGAAASLLDGFRNGEFDSSDYFLRDPRFAQFFTKYEKLAVITQYTLYRRR